MQRHPMTISAKGVKGNVLLKKKEQVIKTCFRLNIKTKFYTMFCHDKQSFKNFLFQVYFIILY